MSSTDLLHPTSAVSSYHFPSHPTATSSNLGSSTAHMDHHSDDDDGNKKGGGLGPANGGGKSRRELPAGAVATLKAWLLSPEHFTHPYPTPQDQAMLMQKTGIDKKQLKNWFTNARRRIWKPMLKKQLEAGKLAAQGGGTLTIAAQAPAPYAPAATAGVPRPELSGSTSGGGAGAQQQQPQQEMYANYQQAQQQQVTEDSNNQDYGQQQQVYDQNGQPIQQHQQLYDQYGNPVYQDQNGYQQQQYQQQKAQPQQQQFPVSNSIGSLAPLGPTSSLGSLSRMIKTDSHAVLMELFARDQDLVRQAAGKQTAQQQQQSTSPSGPNTRGKTADLQPSGVSQGNIRWANGTADPAPSASPANNMGARQPSVTFEGVPSLSSWPHFSSVSSLNNLGGLQGVKSITNLSAADLSSQGNLNKMGNLAQVKSVENMGRGDSFAFLEVFFDDKSGVANGGGQRGIKREREYDDAIGLSLDGDDGASPGQPLKPSGEQAPAAAAGAPVPAPLPENGTDNIDAVGSNDDSEPGKLKRAYDDALAARGLIAVRQSSEKLTDLALPAKMQRTLSQEYIKQHNQGQPMGDFFSTNNSLYAPQNNNGSSQQLVQNPTSDPSASPAMAAASTSVKVPSSTKCALCTSVNVDTQLRPCGHMFHGLCLKPSLQTVSGPPVCPICQMPMQSAILAVPSGQGVDAASAAATGAVASESAAAGAVHDN